MRGDLDDLIEAEPDDLDATSEPPEEDEEQEIPDETEEGDEENEPPDIAEPVADRQGRARVEALLAEALRLGQQYGLVEQHADGTLLLPGQRRTTRRPDSECACPQCSPVNQRHWWCVVCSSGPHDWMLTKPQYERQTLKPGGIIGVRQACCSAQCARDYLASIGRQPSGGPSLPASQALDPTLGLPG